jgi:hypothetical protein
VNGAVVAGLVIGALLVGGAVARQARSRDSTQARDAATTSAAAATCPDAAAPAADVDGDGCPEALTIEGGTIEAGEARWSIGEPGDVVAVGDWDCDGLPSPALLRPSSGDVFVFPGWAELDRPVTVEASGTAAGSVGIRAHPSGDGCDELRVEQPSGLETSVEVASP